MINNVIEKTLTGKGDSDKHLMLLYSLVIGSGANDLMQSNSCPFYYSDLTVKTGQWANADHIEQWQN